MPSSSRSRRPGLVAGAAAGVAAAAGLLGAAVLRRSTRAASGGHAPQAAAAHAAAPTSASPFDRPAGHVHDGWAESADGTRIRYHVHGPAPAPTVVLAHGWTCSARFWNPQVNDLAPGLRVVTYDQRGHGESTVGRATRFGVDELADDLAAVLAATLADDRTAVLVGHSMGGITILSWAGRYPEQVARYASGVVLASTAVAGLIDEALLVRLPASWSRSRTRIGTVFVSSTAPMGRPSPFTKAAIRYAALSPSATPAMVAFSEREVLACPGRTRAGWGRALMGLDLASAVANLTVPTTVVVGTRDRLTPPVHARAIAGALEADGHLHHFLTLPGVGHMTPIEATAQVNDEIRELVARVAVPK